MAKLVARSFECVVAGGSCVVEDWGQRMTRDLACRRKVSQEEDKTIVRQGANSERAARVSHSQAMLCSQESQMEEGEERIGA